MGKFVQAGNAPSRPEIKQHILPPEVAHAHRVALGIGQGERDGRLSRGHLLYLPVEILQEAGVAGEIGTVLREEVAVAGLGDLERHLPDAFGDQVHPGVSPGPPPGYVLQYRNARRIEGFVSQPLHVVLHKFLSVYLLQAVGHPEGVGERVGKIANARPLVDQGFEREKIHPFGFPEHRAALLFGIKALLAAAVGDPLQSFHQVLAHRLVVVRLQGRVRQQGVGRAIPPAVELDHLVLFALPEGGELLGYPRLVPLLFPPVGAEELVPRSFVSLHRHGIGEIRPGHVHAKLCTRTQDQRIAVLPDVQVGEPGGIRRYIDRPVAVLPHRTVVVRLGVLVVEPRRLENELGRAQVIYFRPKGGVIRVLAPCEQQCDQYKRQKAGLSHGVPA